MLEVEDVGDVACTAVPDDMEATDERTGVREVWNEDSGYSTVISIN